MARVTDPPIEVWRVGYSRSQGMSGGGHVEWFEERADVERFLDRLLLDARNERATVTNLTVHRHGTTQWDKFEWDQPAPSLRSANGTDSDVPYTTESEVRE